MKPLTAIRDSALGPGVEGIPYRSWKHSGVMPIIKADNTSAEQYAGMSSWVKFDLFSLFSISGTIRGAGFLIWATVKLRTTVAPKGEHIRHSLLTRR